MVVVANATAALMLERQACVDRIGAIDRELADGAAAMRAALQPPAAAAESATPAAAPPGRTHAAANRQAAGAIKHAHEVKTALVKGPLGIVAVVKACRKLKREDVKRTLKALHKAGDVVKIGDRGPHCKWALKGATTLRPAPAAQPATAVTERRAAVPSPARSSAVSVRDEEFEVAWPLPSDPKAPLSALGAARA